MNAVTKHFTVTLNSDEYEEETLRVYRVSDLGTKNWVGLPRGRLDLVQKVIKDKTVKHLYDVRTEKPTKLKLKFNGTYKPYQKKAIKAMLTEDSGVLKSPPRTGKTIMGVGLILKRKQKTLILTHQRDLIEQFCNETINHPEATLFNGIDHPELAAICKTYEDFKQYPICLATYQTFLSKKGQRLLAKIKDMFGMVMVDEVHRAPANRYFQILSQFSAKHLIGLSATPDRKDMRYALTDLLIGPIIHETQPDDLLIPKVYGHYTPLKPAHPLPKTWVGLENMIFRNKARNALIVDLAIRDIRNGHTVLIPIKRVQHGLELAKHIDNEYGKKVCFLFTGSIPKNQRQYTRDRMNEDSSIRVVLATRSMLTGMNIPRWSAVYTIAPISNEPTYTQEVQRICTLMEGKKQPIIRYFFDAALGLSFGCFHTCLRTLSKYRYDKSFSSMASSHGKRKGETPDVYRAPGRETSKPPRRRKPRGKVA